MVGVVNDNGKLERCILLPEGDMWYLLAHFLLERKGGFGS